MIDLFSVKLNNNYDEIGVAPTIDNGLFLCDTTGENYVRGYSYQVETKGNNKTVTRFDAVSDYKIQQAIYPTIQNVCEWLNNWFTLKYDYRNNYAFGEYGLSGSFHEVAQLPSNGDLCKIRVTNNWDLISLYNTYFVSYVTVTDGVITADNPLFKENQPYYFYIMRLPLDVEQGISSIIYYDVFTRGEVSDLKSESVGSYSYSKYDTTIGTLSYPYPLIAGLDSCYKKVRFVQ